MKCVRVVVLLPPNHPNSIINYKVYFRAQKPPELGEYEKYDFKFELPNQLEVWEMENPEVDKYKIFIPESEVGCPSIFLFI